MVNFDMLHSNSKSNFSSVASKPIYYTICFILFQIQKMDQKIDQVIFLLNSLLKSKSVNENALEDEV